MPFFNKLSSKLNFHDWILFSAAGLWCSLTFSKALIEIFFVLLLVSWVLAHASKQLNDYVKIPASVWIPLAGFAFLVLLSGFFSEIPKNSFRGILKISKQILVFIIIADSLRFPKLLRKAETWFLFIAWLVMMNGLCQYAFGRDFLRWKLGESSGAGIRVSASFGSYGIFAAFLIMTIPYLIACARFLQKKKEYSRACLASIVSAISLVLLFLTRSRGAMLAAGLAWSLMLILQKKYKLFFGLLLLGGLFVFTLPRNMLIHLDADLKEQSIVERYYLWDRAVHVIKAKPLTGTGINTYADTHARYDKTQNWRVRNYYAHNGYLQLAAETGLPCLAAFLMFLFSSFLYSVKALKRTVSETNLRWGLLTGILSFLIFAAVDTVLQSPPPVMTFWYLLGLLFAYTASRSPEESLESYS